MLRVSELVAAVLALSSLLCGAACTSVPFTNVAPAGTETFAAVKLVDVEPVRSAASVDSNSCEASRFQHSSSLH